MKRYKPVVKFWLSAALMIVAASVFAVYIQPGRGSIGGLPVGAIAPEITADGWINGDAPTAADIKGKVVVVESWAHW
jgi:hypothetical protein